MQIKSSETIIGFIGLGVMGRSMAAHILDAGFKMHVYTRTKNKARSLVEKGAVWENSPVGLSEKSDAIITIVGFPSDVEEIYLGKNGILNNAKKGSIVIDMTTSSPDLAARIYDAAAEKGIASLDAPVSGGDIGAKNAALSIMAGGDRQVFDSVLPLFRIMGKNIVYQGGPGSGQHTKMANQIAIAANMIGVCEAIAYSKKAGLDPEIVLESIGQGAAGSWSLNNLGPRIIKGDMEPGFYIKHFIKDMGIALDSSKRLEMHTPGLELALSLYKKAAERGYEEKGTQALSKMFD